MTKTAQYVLKTEREELERLELQAASIEPATRAHLNMSGIRAGMRVLDLGTGVGDVAFLVSELVGPSGEVVGIDQSIEALTRAEGRRADRGLKNVQFLEGDVRSWRDAEPFDAVVGRLILFHLPSDAVAIVRHHAAGVRPGGVVLMMDFDLGAARTEPPVALTSEALSRLMLAFRRVGADPVIGTRLRRILADAGLCDVQAVGLQSYLEPDGLGAKLLASVSRSLLPAIVKTGVATAAEVQIDTLEDRLRAAIIAADATFMPPMLTGAAGRTAA